MNKIYLLVAFFSVPFFSYADESDTFFDLNLEELSRISVVTAASGFEQKVSRAPANVTVITSEQWQTSGARTLSDILATVPGVHIGKPPIQYKHKKIILRGLTGDDSAQIKLLIDGEPFDYMQSGGLFSGFHLPLTAFKRVEIVKGPGSAIYGADAYGGVINLVSYKEGESEAVVGARAGSFGTYDVFARKDFLLSGASLQLSLDYSRSDDDKNKVVSSDLQTVFDNIFGTNASNAPGRIDEHHEVFSAMAKWHWQKADLELFTWRNLGSGSAGGIAQALDPDARISAYFNHYKFRYDLSTFIAGKLTATVSYKEQASKSYLHVFPSGSVLPIGQDGNLDFVSPTSFTYFSDGYIGTPSPKGISVTYRLTHLFNITDSHLFRWESGYEQQKFRTFESKNFGPGILNGDELIVDGQLTNVTGTPYIYLPDVDRNFYYLSLQDEWQLRKNVQLTMGLRYDNYSDFGATTNPRVGLLWQTSDSLSLKFFAGTAIKSPSISQLYAQNNPVGLGNPKLQPETVKTIETGLALEYFINEDLLLSASLFSYHAKDLVEFAFDEQRQGNVAQNIGEQKGKGAEFTIKWKPIKNVIIDGNYSYLSSKDGMEKLTADIPFNMAYLAMNWQISDNWYWNINAKLIANRVRSDGDMRKKLPSYVWSTSRLERRDILDGVDASLIVNNLLDKRAKEPSRGSIADDFPLIGRQIFLEFSYNF